MPSVKKEDIDVSMHEDLVHVHVERVDLTFHRNVHFPILVKPKEAEANFFSDLIPFEVR